MTVNTRVTEDDRKKAIHFDRLEVAILGIEQYDLRKMVEERTIIVRP